jgi:hypothetical protein
MALSNEKASPVLTTMDPEQALTSESKVTGHAHGYVDDLSEVEASKGWFGAVVRYTQFLPVEERGIERVKEENRGKQNYFDGFTMWASANFTQVHALISVEAVEAA